MKIFIPESFRHVCERCGFCCRDYPATFTRDEMDTAVKCAQSLPPEEMPPHPFFVTVAQNPNRFFNVMGENGCVFLRDGGCILHARFGPESKSRICRSFPAKSTVTPVGIFGSLYFGCPAALRNLSFPFNITERDSSEIIPDTDKTPVIRGTLTVPWEHLVSISAALINIVSDTNFTLRESLLACIELIKILSFRLGRKDPSPISDILDRALTAIRMKSAQRPRTPDESLDTSALDFLLEFTTQVECILNKTVVVQPAAFSAFIGKLSNSLELGPDGQPSSGAVKCYLAFVRKWRAEREEIFSRELRNYILWKIFDKEIFLEFGISSGFHLMCLGFALIRLYTFALNAAESREGIDFESIMYPIQLVDKYLFHNKLSIHSLLDGNESSGIDNPDLIAGLL
jgi:hypothetical protein